MADAAAYNRLQGNAPANWLQDPSVPLHRNYLTPLGDGPNAGFWPDYRDPGNEVVQRGAILPFARYQDGRIHPAMPSLLDGPIQGLATAATIDPRENSADANNRLSQAAFDVGGLAAVSGMVAPRPANSLGMFGGRMAKTADQSALAEAERLATSGTPREDIWNKTGWFQGPDKKWRFEIDDNGAKFEPKGLYDGSPLSDFMPHAQAFAAYPDVANIRTGTVAGSSGSFGKVIAVGKESSNQTSQALHEMQHAIQQRERFAEGGLPQDFGKLPASEQAALIDKTALEYGSAYAPTMAGLKWYERLAGETEARLVQKRMDLTAEQRRARAPWLDYDVPESQQIVRNSLQGPAMSAPPLMQNALQTEAQPGIRAYHGSRPNTPIEGRTAPLWSAPGEDGAVYAGAWAGKSGAVYPLEIDTSKYLKVKDNSLLQKIDDRFGSGREASGQKNLVDPVAKALGYKGFDYEYLPRDGQRVIKSLDLNTVKSPLTGTPIAALPPDRTKYLDQGSRTAGEGSRNYVVFDPATIEIMRKYGIVPPAMLGAASQTNRLQGDE